MWSPDVIFVSTRPDTDGGVRIDVLSAGAEEDHPAQLVFSGSLTLTHNTMIVGTVDEESSLHG